MQLDSFNLYLKELFTDASYQAIRRVSVELLEDEAIAPRFTAPGFVPGPPIARRVGAYGKTLQYIIKIKIFTIILFNFTIKKNILDKGNTSKGNFS